MRAQLIAIYCVAAWAARAAEPAAAPVDPAVAAQVARLFAQLNADDFRVRDAAATAAEDLPAEALPLIEDALSTGELSPEVALRLEAKIALLRRKAAATPYERALRRELDWNRDTALAAYDRGGHANPTWDAAAREAIVLSARPRFDPNRSSRDDARIDAALRKAIDLGCDDPFVLFLRADRYLAWSGHDPRRAADLVDAPAAGVLAGNYPPYRKLTAALARARAVGAAEPQELSPGARRDLERDLDAALALFAPAAEEGAPRPLLFEAALSAYGVAVRLNPDEDAALARVRSTLAKAAGPGSNVASLFAAEVAVRRAEAAERERWRFERLNVDPLVAERVKQRDAHLAAATASVEAALAVDPNDPPALDAMLRVLRLTGATRERFDEWFARAIAAYPNDLRACQAKRAYLQASGAADDALAFGRECLAGGNWSSRIPFVLLDVHLNTARPDRPEEYFADPDVWNDVRAVLEGYLKRYPNAVYDRTQLARLACYAGAWELAKAQFDRLGDDAAYGVFRGKQTYDYYKRKAERLAGRGG